MFFTISVYLFFTLQLKSQCLSWEKNPNQSEKRFVWVNSGTWNVTGVFQPLHLGVDLRSWLWGWRNSSVDLLHKHEDLSSDILLPCRKCGSVMHTWNATPGEAAPGGSWSSMARLSSQNAELRVQWEALSWKERWRVIADTWHVSLASICTPTCTCVYCPYTQTLPMHYAE